MECMNVVLAKHEGDFMTYAFEVPSFMIKYIHKGTILLVSTCRGEEIAIAQTAVITGEAAKDVAELHGAYFPLKPVLSFVNKKIMDYFGVKEVD